MFEHKTFKALDLYGIIDSVLTTLGMVVILALFFTVMILIFLN